MRYRDDPAILGYDLMNEPRCDCAGIHMSAADAAAADARGCNADCTQRLTVRGLGVCVAGRLAD